MVTFLTILAHAGEEHSNTAATVTHTLAPWYIAVPVFLISVAVIGYLAWLVSGKKLDIVAVVLSIVLLISGFTLFNVSAAISVISITVGLVLTGAIALIGLAEDSDQK